MDRRRAARAHRAGARRGAGASRSASTSSCRAARPTRRLRQPPAVRDQLDLCFAERSRSIVSGLGDPTTMLNEARRGRLPLRRRRRQRARRHARWRAPAPTRSSSQGNEAGGHVGPTGHADARAVRDPRGRRSRCCSPAGLPPPEAVRRRWRWARPASRSAPASSPAEESDAHPAYKRAVVEADERARPSSREPARASRRGPCARPSSSRGRAARTRSSRIPSALAAILASPCRLRRRRSRGRLSPDGPVRSAWSTACCRPPRSSIC